MGEGADPGCVGIKGRNRGTVMWHPKNEAEACSAVAALIEWLRASRGLHMLDPVSLRAWHEAEPESFAEAFQSFAPETATATRQQRIAVLFSEWDRITPPV
eukprot:gene12888-12987_t